jgi:hypothetical protein
MVESSELIRLRRGFGATKKVRSPQSTSVFAEASARPVKKKRGKNLQKSAKNHKTRGVGDAKKCKKEKGRGSGENSELAAERAAVPGKKLAPNSSKQFQRAPIRLRRGFGAIRETDGNEDGWRIESSLLWSALSISLMPAPFEDIRQFGGLICSRGRWGY